MVYRRKCTYNSSLGSASRSGKSVFSSRFQAVATQIRLTDIIPTRKRGSSSGGVVTARRQNANSKDKSIAYINNIDQAHCRKFSFFPETESLNNMQPLPLPDIKQWVMRDSDLNLIKQRKAFEKSWMTKEKIPIYAGFSNLRRLEDFAPPKWWAKSKGGENTLSAMVKPQSEEQSAERAQIVTEIVATRAKGQTLGYTLEVNNKVSTPEYAAILKYGSVQALAEYSDCEGYLIMYYKCPMGYTTVPTPTITPMRNR